MSQANREQLQQINTLIKSGKTTEAKKMLVPLLKAEPDNAAGWWLMVNAISDPEHKRRALQRFLQLRPNDAKGQAMLAKLDASPIEDDPFSDPDNPFVAAKQAGAASEPRKSLINKPRDDNPFGDVEGDDDPFAEVPSTGLRFQAQRSTGTIPRTTGTIARSTSTLEKAKVNEAPPKSSSNTTWLILGGAVLVAIIAIGAAVLISGTRNNTGATGGNPDAYVEPQVYCDDEEITFNENDDVGARLPSRVMNLGRLSLGDTASGDFSGENELHAYTFNGTSGQWIVIEMWSPDGSIDPQVEMYDPNNEQFAFCDDSTTGEGEYNLDTYMQVQLPRDGQYMIVAQQFGLSQGSYRISVRER